MNNEKIKMLFAIAVVGLLILSLTAVSIHTKAVEAGGEITNQAPAIPSDLWGSISSKTNAATETEQFNGTVYDANGEADIAWVNWTTNNGTGTTYSKQRPAGGWEVGKPGSGAGIDSDGIAVWNETSVQNGNLSYQVRFTWFAGIPTGTFTQKIFATDDSPATAESDPDDTTAITTFVSVTWLVVETTNVTASPQTWSFPASAPGAAGVNSTRWVRAYNSGSGTATLSVSFTDFQNITKGGLIDVTANANLKFRFNNTPEQMNDTTNTTWDADTDGTIGGISLPAGGYMFFAYQIVAMPAILPVGKYSATATCEAS